MTASTSPVPALDLPDPRIAEGTDVIIYDGHCKFCRKQVVRLKWFDWGSRLSFVSLHDPWVYEQFPDLTHDQLMEEMYCVDQRGQRYGGAAAFRYLTRRLPTLWFLAPLMHIPFSLPVWSWMYRTIARHRYRWGRIDDSCEDGACHIHFR